MPSRRQGPRPGGSEGGRPAGGDVPSRRWWRRLRLRRRLETEGEEVRGGEGARARAREGRSGGGEVGPAGGRAAAAAAGDSGAPGCGADAAPSDPPRSRARPPEPRAPSPERAPWPPRPPRASLSLDALPPPPPPGRQRAPSKLRARLSARGKVSPAAADASWHGVRPLRLEGRGPAPLCSPRAPPPRPPGDLGAHARPPPPPRRGGGGGWNGGALPGWSRGSPGTEFYFGYRLGKGRGRRARPHPRSEPAEGRRRPPGTGAPRPRAPGRVSGGRLQNGAGRGAGVVTRSRGSARAESGGEGVRATPLCKGMGRGRR